MMQLSQAATVLDSHVEGRDVYFRAVSKDTRTLVSGDLYVALKGARFDGHRYLEQAAEKGAVAALVSEIQVSPLPQIRVDDTRLALGRLAAYWAGRWRDRNATEEKRLIAITGSNGKTTVKEMCRSILARVVGEAAVYATPGNLNNDIGVPMCLLALRDHHRYAVIEMGASAGGEIDYLSRLAKPDVAAITNAGNAHLEGFGSEAGIAAAKAEIFHGLRSSGTAVINRDDRYAGQWRQHAAAYRQQHFSMRDEQADYYACELGGERYRLVTPQGETGVQLPVPGRHNMMNALCAAAASSVAAVTLAQLKQGLEGFEPVGGRLRTAMLADGVRLIDDSYNANPLSMKAAIEVLAACPGRRYLVMGQMAELGREADALHAEVARYAAGRRIDALLVVGASAAAAAGAFGENARVFADRRALFEDLRRRLQAGDSVLVKGSRSAGMEQVVQWLENESASTGDAVPSTPEAPAS